MTDLTTALDRLALHIERTPLGVIEWGSDFKVVRWNPAAARIFGYTAAEARGRHAADLIVPESARPHVDRVWRELLMRRGGESSTNENLTKDGRRILCEWHNTALVSDEGAVVGVASFVQDITERTLLQAALVNSEERYRVLVDSTPDLIYSADLDGRFTAVNRTMCQTLGRSSDELIGLRPVEVTAEPAVADKWMQAHERVLNTGEPIEDEWSATLADGRVHTYQAILRPVRDAHGRLVGLRGVSREVTERKRLELEQQRLSAAIARSEQLLRAIIDAAPIGIAVLGGPDFTFELVNQPYARLVGGTAIGRPFAEVLPDIAPLVLPMLERVAAGDEVPAIVDVDAGVAPQGGERGRSCFTFSYVRVWLPDGTPRILALATDTSERVLLEEQFRQAQKMEAIGRLAGGIAHDFNNLLTGILGYAEMVANSLDDGHPARRDVDEIVHAGNSAAALTQQLLAFSRKQILQPAVHDLNEIVRENTRLIERVLGEDIEIDAHLRADLPTVKIDRGQIEQVLMNLTVNARDAMPEGGRLTVETANVTLDESYARMHVAVTPGPYVMLAVSDTGCGMAPEVQARLFEPFFTTKEKGKGTGLGLATVYGIVKQSGGNIWAYSEPNHGTTFKIYLPRVESVAEAEPIPAASPAPVGEERILLVEDDGPLRELAVKALEGQGYRVLPAADPASALELSAQHTTPIAMLLTDVVLPGMSGRALANQLQVSRPGIRVLYMSGYTDEAIVHHGVLDSGTAFLQKPFTPARLVRKVREVLSAAKG